MDLIIKPTQACNFNCSFCSSNNISKNKQLLDMKTILHVLENNKVNTIIVNGGDPLMVCPDYYWKIIDFLDDNKMNTTISFTSNLWDFYLRPDKWIDLFLNERVRVCTSFQYGDERRLADGTVFTETLFRKVFEKYKKLLNRKLTFISVITKNNEDKVIDTVLLAKDLETECKINPAFASGRSAEHYPFYKAYEKYLDIIEAGLEQYEFNSREIKKLYQGGHTCCPYCRDCYKTIRAINPDGIIHSCGAFNDDYYDNLRLNKKTYCLVDDNEKEMLKDFKSLKNECFGCELFAFCNSCYKRIHDIKASDSVDENCLEMKKMLPRIKKLL